MKILYFYQATGSIYARFAFYFIAVISSVSNLLSQDFTNMQKEDLFDIGGNIGGSLSFSDYGGSYSQQSPWSSVISAGLHMKLAGIDVPLSFTYVDGKSSYMHPFTRYGLSPRYKNYTLHLGYRSMNLSSSVFSGKTYYGLGSEINFDNVKLALFYGEIEQARAYDTAFAYRPPTYSRLAMGGKIGFTVSSFALDLVLFKAKDESSSIILPPNAIITPQDNLVGAISSRFSFLGHFNFSTEWSVSAHTKDINGDEIGGETANKYNAFFATRANSTIGYTSNNTLGFNWGIFNSQLNYRQVSQDYQSLGSPSISTDYRSAGINTGLQLFENKLHISGFFSMQNNNLSKNQQMTTYTKSFGLNTQANIDANFNISGNYNGILVNQKPENPDTLQIAGNYHMMTHNISLVPNYSIPDNNISHSFSLPINFYSTSIESDMSGGNNESGSITLSPSYSLNLSEYNLSTGISYSFSSQISTTSSNRHSIGINANKTFLEDNSLSVNSSVNFGIDNNGNSGNKNISFSAGGSYRLFEQHSFSLNINYSLGFSDSVANYENYRGSLSYQWNIPSLIHKNKNKKNE